MALRRVKREMKAIKDNAPYNISGGPINDDLFKWRAMIIGPKNSLYEDGIYLIDITFPASYPFKPPVLYWSNNIRIFHPILSISQKICIPLLHDSWSPAKLIWTVLKEISDMMADLDYNHCCPCCGHINECDRSYNRYDPIKSSKATGLYIKDREQFNKTAMEWNTLYAKFDIITDSDILIVNGYIRQSLNDTLIPNDVIKICISYYQKMILNEVKETLHDWDQLKILIDDVILDLLQPVYGNRIDIDGKDPLNEIYDPEYMHPLYRGAVQTNAEILGEVNTTSGDNVVINNNGCCIVL